MLHALALRSAAVLATVGALALGSLPAQAASERAVEVYPVAGASSITVTGNGYGHGNGMSQWGAKGAAAQGLSWQQIIAFYYPGTTLGQTAGKVRVLLTADTTNDVRIRAQDGVRVRSLKKKRTWRLPDNGAVQWRLIGDRAATRVQFRKRAGWRNWKRFPGDAEFRSSTGPMTLITPAGRTDYRGALRSASPTPGKNARDTVNVLSMEQYLRGVVPREIPALWESAAVSSQSVAARTYAAFERADNASRYYDLCDSESCQVYGGVADEHSAANAAIAATKGSIVLWEGTPAFTQFSASNGGYASAGSQPYLVAQPDPYDTAYRAWSVPVSDTALEAQWPAVGDLTSIEVTGRDGNGEWGGRVTSMALVGTAGRVEITGDDFRFAFGLRSDWFTLAVQPVSRRVPVELP